MNVLNFSCLFLALFTLSQAKSGDANAELGEFRKLLGTFSKRINQLERNLEEKNVEILKIKTMCQSAGPYAGEFVGFMARPSTTYFYQNGDRMIYDDVILNPSNSYNVTANSFTCPFSGYYEFTVTVASVVNAENVGKRIDGELVVGGGPHVLKAIAEKGDILTQGTITGIFRCEEGTEVYVRAGPGDDVGNYGGGHSIFTGHLVRMDTP